MGHVLLTPCGCASPRLSPDAQQPTTSNQPTAGVVAAVGAPSTAAPFFPAFNRAKGVAAAAAAPPPTEAELLERRERERAADRDRQRRRRKEERELPETPARLERRERKRAADRELPEAE
jgi:hypothetical protein